MNEYICPNCKNPIYDEDALLCHFCGGSLKRPGKGFIGGLRYSNKGLIWVLLVIFVLLAFVFLFVY